MPFTFTHSFGYPALENTILAVAFPSFTSTFSQVILVLDDPPTFASILYVPSFSSPVVPLTTDSFARAAFFFASSSSAVSVPLPAASALFSS